MIGWMDGCEDEQKAVVLLGRRIKKKMRGEGRREGHHLCVHTTSQQVSGRASSPMFMPSSWLTCNTLPVPLEVEISDCFRNSVMSYNVLLE